MVFYMERHFNTQPVLSVSDCEASRYCGRGTWGDLFLPESTQDVVCKPRCRADDSEDVGLESSTPWCFVGNGGMDYGDYYWGLYRGYYRDPCPHSLLSTRE